MGPDATSKSLSSVQSILDQGADLVGTLDTIERVWTLPSCEAGRTMDGAPTSGRPDHLEAIGGGKGSSVALLGPDIASVASALLPIIILGQSIRNAASDDDAAGGVATRVANSPGAATSTAPSGDAEATRHAMHRARCDALVAAAALPCGAAIAGLSALAPQRGLFGRSEAWHGWGKSVGDWESLYTSFRNIRGPCIIRSGKQQALPFPTRKRSGCSIHRTFGSITSRLALKQGYK